MVSLENGRPQRPERQRALAVVASTRAARTDDGQDIAARKLRQVPGSGHHWRIDSGDGDTGSRGRAFLRTGTYRNPRRRCGLRYGT